MKYIDEIIREETYYQMCGMTGQDKELQDGADYVKNEYADGEICEQLSEEIYRTVQEINERLGSERETEIILKDYETILHMLCTKMYDYGRNSALKDQQIFNAE